MIGTRNREKKKTFITPKKFKMEPEKKKKKREKIITPKNPINLFDNYKYNLNC